MSIGGWWSRLARGLRGLRRPGNTSEARFRQLFEKLPEPVWIVTDTHFVEANSAALAAIGYTHHPEILHLHPAEVSPEYQPDGELSRAKAERMARLGLEKGSHRFEWVHKRLDGSLFPVEVTLTPMDWMGKSSTCCIWRDISERKQQEQQLRLSQFSIDRATDAIYWLNPDGRIVHANPAACSMLGMPLAELIGKTVPEIDVNFTPELWRGHWTDLKQRGSIRLESMQPRADGTVFPVEVSANYIGFEGQEYNCAIVRDISGHNRILKALREREAELKSESARNRYLLQAATDGIHVVDGQGRIILANSAFANSLGFRNDEVLGLHVTDFDAVFPPAQVDLNLNEWLQQEEPLTFETLHRRRNGDTFAVEVTASRVMLDDQPVLFASSRDISERKRLEATLREKTDQLETIFEHATIGLALSEDRIIVRANRALVNLFGYGEEELIGQTSAQLFPSVAAYQQSGTSEDLARLRSGEVLVSEMALRHKHGQDLWVRVAAKVVDPKAQSLQIISMVEDITARRETEARNRQLLDILDDANDFIGMSTAQGQLTYLNPQALRLLGFPEDTNPQTLSIRSLHSQDQYDRLIKDLIPDIVEKGHWIGELPFQHQDGHELPLSCAVSAHRDENGNVIAISNIARDITAEKQAQMALIAAKEAAEAATRAKSEFLAHMSHEIRTPMNAVLGLAQLLDREPLTPGQAAMVRHIGEAGEALLRVINDILDFSKAEAGQIRIDRQPFSVSEMLGHIDQLFRSTAEGKALAFTVSDIPDDLGALLGDRIRLEQILINLVSNAIKFTPAGSVALVVTRVAGGEKSLRLRFEVRDTGIGLSQPVQSQLFQPFSQGDASITRRFGGTGLGLAISKRLAKLMEGEIGVISEEGQGSTFWLELPFERAGVVAETSTVTPPSTTETSGPHLVGLHILAVDDNRINLMVLEKALKNEGAEVTLAADGQQALQILQARPGDFQVVLMDVQMPVMDGLSATRAIRNDPALRHLPVVALTAGVLPEERQAALDAGVDGFLAKPLDLQQMLATLAECLAKH
jgi:PAS domain S-box-containing protein